MPYGDENRDRGGPFGRLSILASCMTLASCALDALRQNDLLIPKTRVTYELLLSIKVIGLVSLLTAYVLALLADFDRYKQIRWCWWLFWIALFIFLAQPLVIEDYG